MKRRKLADVEEIKKRLDIVAIVSEYLPLKKAGVTYKALCPFHSERTPSFTVSAERASWHCFGCNEGGDVISFVQKIDGLDFREALERLATRAGVELDDRPIDKVKRSEKSQIYEVMNVLTNLYHELLLHHPSAEPARRYLTKRGVSAEMIEKWRLGFAPNAWHTVDHALVKKGFDNSFGYKSGMSVQKGPNQIYDRFRDRLMFPIDDVSGRVVGFTGRILADTENEAKYINTSESSIFKKSEAVFGISHAKQAIRDAKKAIMVEGQMDCITAHQFGLTNTVATSGTALTAEHIALLKRYGDTIVFAFDNDEAGQKAAYLATNLCFSFEINPLMVRIPHGKDPDESIRTNQKDFAVAVENAEAAIDYFLKLALGNQKELSAVAKKTVTSRLLPLVRLVKNQVEQAEYIHRIAERLQVPEASVERELRHGTSSEQSLPTAPSNKQKTPESLDLERQVIGLCVAYQSLIPKMPQIIFANSALQSIYDLIVQAQKEQKKLTDLLKILPKDWQDRVNGLMFETLRRHEKLEEADIRKEIVDALERLNVRDREARIASRAKAIAEAFSRGDKAKARQLLGALNSDTISR